ncbi:succinic semialdehyde dehydrogenase [Phycicoccus endophyticus]|uniref:succinic semialdehyde dehydrogenase n=1 Tax=Phycicoccus endophyticus TaxID=1690220 RepID=UPI00140D46A4|nr:succinic semialdehyde dehydrogenase [Phycicoccus endophyticus]NHI20689.1 succinate-semialdehyde dehydrogenase (NADP(+)) [Phycicoccus endophyticus]GGL35719.1 succinic semialdehyde dehydrogenase [Phycicoccus endophyticus]
MADVIADPETDPHATYVLDPASVRALTSRVLASGEPMTTRTPMTGAPLATLPTSTPADVAVALDRARAAQRAWAARPVAERARLLLALHDLVLDRRSELLDIVQLESGKTRAQAFEEVADVAVVCRHYARRGPALLADRRHLGALPLLTRSTEHHRPKGVVGVVSPWNYPLTLSVTDALPALLAGNAVLLRPDPQGTLTALHALALLVEAGFPEDLVQVVLGGAETGAAVVERADYVCFTGSTATGRSVAASAGRRLVGASLELGGKNAVYVADDADLRRAVPGVLHACFSSAGQLCVSAERLIVHERVADELLARLVDAMGRMRLSTGLHWDADMGSLVGPAQLARVLAHLEDAVAKGASVLAGGRARPDIGPYVLEPTLLTGVTSAMACRDEETFGPLVALYRVQDDDAAVALANDTEYGLNASVWTRDVRRGRRFAARVQAGTVNVNEGYAAAWGSVGSPMGGMKASGLGRRHGREGLLKYTESQNVTVQRLVNIADLPGLRGAGYARALTGALRAMRAVGLP